MDLVVSGEPRGLSPKNVQRSELLKRTDPSVEAELTVSPRAFDAWGHQQGIEDMDVALLMKVVAVRPIEAETQSSLRALAITCWPLRAPGPGSACTSTSRMNDTGQLGLCAYVVLWLCHCVDSLVAARDCRRLSVHESIRTHHVLIDSSALKAIACICTLSIERLEICRMRVQKTGEPSFTRFVPRSRAALPG